jgi:large subunit ribosomal protein L28
VTVFYRNPGTASPPFSGPSPCQSVPTYGILRDSPVRVITRRITDMSKVCAICGKKPSFGSNRSHSMRATPRRWNVNVHKIRIMVAGKPGRAYVCAKCLKAHKVEKVA